MSYQLESKLMRVREGEGQCDGGSLSCAEMGHQKRRPDVRRSPALVWCQWKEILLRQLVTWSWNSGPRCGRGRKLVIPHMCVVLGAKAAWEEAPWQETRTGQEWPTAAQLGYFPLLVMKMLKHRKCLQIHTLTDPVQLYIVHMSGHTWLPILHIYPSAACLL